MRSCGVGLILFDADAQTTTHRIACIYTFTHRTPLSVSSPANLPAHASPRHAHAYARTRVQRRQSTISSRNVQRMP
eukprot:6181005-Pleurochrysis_carterae.AAC.1